MGGSTKKAQRREKKDERIDDQRYKTHHSEVHYETTQRTLARFYYSLKLYHKICQYNQEFETTNDSRRFHGRLKNRSIPWWVIGIDLFLSSPIAF